MCIVQPRLGAQVGIRTDNPQGMFHVDAKGDTGSLLNDTLDDVVVTSQGRIGIGTLHPQTRLDIVDPSTAGIIRIQDTTEGPGKILTSDAGGRASWKPVAGSWYAALTGGSMSGASSGTELQVWPPFIYTAAAWYPTERGNAVASTGRITVPFSGTYRISVTGRGNTNLPNSVSAGYFLTFLQVFVNVATSARVSSLVHALRKFGDADFGYMYVFSLQENDVVWIAATPRSQDHSANQYSDVTFQLEFIK